MSVEQWFWFGKWLKQQSEGSPSLFTSHPSGGSFDTSERFPGGGSRAVQESGTQIVCGSVVGTAGEVCPRMYSVWGGSSRGTLRAGGRCMFAGSVEVMFLFSANPCGNGIPGSSAVLVSRGPGIPEGHRCAARLRGARLVGARPRAGFAIFAYL